MVLLMECIVTAKEEHIGIGQQQMEIIIMQLEMQSIMIHVQALVEIKELLK